MDLPIRPREEVGRYVCWIDGYESEAEGRAVGYKFWRATARHAALAHAQWMADEGDYPDHVGQDFCVMVRDLVDGALTRVPIYWEYDPQACAREEVVVEPAPEQCHG